ncbi:RING finger protein ETP1-like protein [Elsinoe fawcettii]|nr:RING finger protein ETP1-like protein [Elsinoe fawcettii]
MPTFLYHLKLELYPQSASETSKRESQANSIFVPPAGTDIFTNQLPAHKVTPWTSDFTHTRSKNSLSTPPASRILTPEIRPTSAGQIDSPGDALLLPERNPALKENQAHVPSSPRPSSKHASKDWRFGPVSIESIDMEAQDKTSAGKETGASHTRAIYVPSETKTTDVGWGVVHLYKDSQEVSDLNTSGKKGLSKDQESSFDIDKCSTLCILAVPSWMMPSDLLGFVGDQTREDVSHFRLIRTGRANKYMVLMKFRSPKKARDWQRAWNGRLFSAMEPENCHVVFISTVTFLTPTSSFPHSPTDPFTTSTLKPLPPPTSSLTELPTCPVCLERMDSTTGLLTILCQHVFHCACLEKWRGSGCPVCRFSQSPSSTFPFPRPQDPTQDPLSEPTCATCSSETNLWICLICGNVGCGRYDSAHAYAHWEATSHCYAMDIGTQHVWDYAGDGYVHRLIQNKDTGASSLGAGTGAGGRFIDVGSGAMGGRRGGHPNEAFRSEGGEVVPREKMEAMASEYTYLLTGQLESQRRYFEEQVQRAVGKASAAANRAEEAGRKLEELMARVEGVETERDGLRGELDAMRGEMEKMKLRGERFEGLARSSMKQVKEEKTINEGLLERIKVMEMEVKEKREGEGKLRGEIEELKELNRDLTMFVEGREQLRKIEEAEGLEKGEVEGGEVLVGEKKGRKGKGRKR